VLLIGIIFREGRIEGTGLGVAKRGVDGKWVYIIENPYGV